MPGADFVEDCLVVGLAEGKLARSRLAQSRLAQSRLAQGKVAMSRLERGVPVRHSVEIRLVVEVAILQPLD